MNIFIRLLAPIAFIHAVFFSDAMGNTSAEVPKPFYGPNAPSLLVAGKVDPITGAYHDTSVDYSIPGPYPLNILRTLIAAEETRFGNFKFLTAPKLYHRCGNEHGFYAIETYVQNETSGCIVFKETNPCRHKHFSPERTHWTPVNYESATNASSGILSALTNYKNSHIKNHVEVQPDGAHVRYQGPSNMGTLGANTWVPAVEKITPEGFKLEYKYSRVEKTRVTHKRDLLSLGFKYEEMGCVGGTYLNRILLKSPSGKVLSYVDLEYLEFLPGEPFESDRRDVIAKTSDGRTFVYKMHRLGKWENRENYNYKSNLLGVQNTDRIPETYKYDGPNGKFSEIQRPDGRYLRFEFQCNGLAWGIKSLFAPASGDSSCPYPILKLNFHKQIDDYQKKTFTGFTEAFDANGNKTEYHYAKDLIYEVRFFKKNGSLDFSHKYYWGKGKDQNRLITLAYVRADKHIEKAIHYVYDDKGNVIIDRVYGLNSGKCHEVGISVNENGAVSGQEFVETKYSYNDQNLCKRKKEPNGRITTYGYKPETNLLACEIVYLEGKKRRKFYEYNEDHSLVKIIEDDGTSAQDAQSLEGVLLRKITKVYPKKSQPGLGKPEAQEVYFLNPKSGSESLAERVEFTYDTKHNLVEEKRYDSNSDLRFVHRWKYDDQSRCIYEEDALGNKTYLAYDSNNNLISKQLPNGAKCTYVYDLMDRLRSKQIQVDGSVHETKYQYDFQGNMVQESEIVDGKTLSSCYYAYDHLNRCIAKKLPDVIGLDGECHESKEKFEYDIFSNPVVTHSPSSCLGSSQTRRGYTFQGNEYYAKYPDGSIETHLYNPDGTVASYTDQFGTQTIFTYDLDQNVTETKVLDRDGNFLKKEQAEFDSFGNMLWFVDAHGNKANYTYDAFGRLESECIEGLSARTQYEYDSLGRQTKIKVYEEEALVFSEEQEFDLLDRVTNEKVILPNGSIQFQKAYAYDCMGNVAEEMEFKAEGVATEKRKFDFLGRLIRVEDPSGDETLFKYEVSSPKTSSLLCQSKRTIFSDKTEVLEFFDPNGNIIETQKLDSDKKCTSLKKNVFDPRGNLIYEAKLEPSSKQELLSISYEYNQSDLCIGKLESCKGKLKETQQKYNQHSQLKERTNALGTVSFSYNTQGLLSRVSCLDADYPVDYTYEYNQLGQLTKAVDHIHELVLRRSYDVFGRLTSDSYGDVEVGSLYSPIGNKVATSLPDGSTIRFEYEGKALKNSSYRGLTTTVISRDLSGEILELELPGNVGRVSKAQDIEGKNFSLKAPFFSQKWELDSQGLIQSVKTSDSRGKYETVYQYDSEGQLTKEKGRHPASYAYDNLRNRVSKNGKAYSYEHLNVTKGEGLKSISYSKLGFPESIVNDAENNFKLSYDALGRLIKVETGEAKKSFVYDPLGRRVIERSGNKQKTFIYDDISEIGAFASGTILELRVPLEDLGPESENSYHYFINGNDYAATYDFNGNLSQLISTYWKSLSALYRYSAFGEMEASEYSKQWSLSYWAGYDKEPLSPWLYASKRAIPEIGLISFGAREYSPVLGRWLTPDPLGSLDGMNPYTYVHNDPINDFDDFGLLSGSGFEWGQDIYAHGVIRAMSSDENLKSSIDRLHGSGTRYHERMHSEMSRVPTGVASFAGGVTRASAQIATKTVEGSATLLFIASRSPRAAGIILKDGFVELGRDVFNFFRHPVQNIRDFENELMGLNPEEIGERLGTVALEGALYLVPTGKAISKLSQFAYRTIRGGFRISKMTAPRFAMGRSRSRTRKNQPPPWSKNSPFKNRTEESLIKLLEDHGYKKEVAKAAYAKKDGKYSYYIDKAGKGKYSNEISHVDVMRTRKFRGKAARKKRFAFRDD